MPVGILVVVYERVERGLGPAHGEPPSLLAEKITLLAGERLIDPRATIQLFQDLQCVVIEVIGPSSPTSDRRSWALRLIRVAVKSST
jgi:hypothetical protein